jgi:hypothetical protein
LGTEPPTVDQKQLSENKINQIGSRLPAQPPLPYGNVPTGLNNIPLKSPSPKLPVTTFSVATPLLPGIVPKKISLSIPQIPDKQESENDIRKRLGMQLLPSLPPKPVVDESALVKTALASINTRQPEIPNPAGISSRVSGVISTVALREAEQLEKMKKLMPNAPIKPKLDQFNVKIPDVPIDTNLLKLNAGGSNGIILAWLTARMGITVPPPGFASVTTNMVVGPGSIIPMKSALGGPKFVSEIVNSLKMHSKTISGVTTGVTPNGSPIALPWVGIS